MLLVFIAKLFLLTYLEVLGIIKLPNSSRYINFIYKIGSINMHISKDLIAASATPLLLAILNKEDSYGYDIIKKVRNSSKNEILWTEGMLYPVLHRLEKNELVESYWKKSDTGRKRKYYRLLEKGRLELEKQIKQWEIVNSTLSDQIYNLVSNEEGEDV